MKICLIIFLCLSFGVLVLADSSDEIRNTYYDSGKLKEELHYKDGKLNGTSNEYYENGKLKGYASFNEGKLDGEFKDFYENGLVEDIENYKDGKLHGTVKEFDVKGKLVSEGEFENGNGEMKCYYPSGNLLWLANLKNGSINVRESPFSRLNFTLLSGECLLKGYYESGNLQQEVLYNNGKKQGLSNYYYENGKLQFQDIYLDGKKNGICKKYYEDGILMYKDTFKVDVLINRKKFTPEGKLEFDQDY